MAWDGSGNFNRNTGTFTGSTVWQQSRDAARKIRADDHDTHDEDLASGLENCLTRDGQNSPSANLPMASFRHTSIGNATARDQYAALGQVQDGGGTYAGTVGGTANAITLTFTPAVAAYAAGQSFRFIVGTANTGATTVDVNGLGVKNLQKNGTTALAADDLPVGALAEIAYDGTRFQLMAVSGTAVATAQNLDLSGTTLTWANDQIPASAINDGSGSGLDADTVDGITSINLVQTTGGQTIDGVKTFTSSVIVSRTVPGFFLEETDESNYRWNPRVAGRVFSIRDDTRGADAISFSNVNGRSRKCVNEHCRFEATGTASFRSNFGISSLTDLGTGQFRLTFSTAKTSANYPVVITPTQDATNVVQVFDLQYFTDKIEFEVRTTDGGGLIDPDECSVMVGENSDG